MKSILMSIQSKWLCEIFNGRKTVELRKRFPKNYRGWLYLYCTKGKPYILRFFWRYFIADDIAPEEKDDGLVKNGLVVARVWVDNVDVGTKLSDGSGYVYLPQKSLCLTNEEIMQYANNSPSLTVIYFSKLEIFDKPKELGEFYKDAWYGDTDECYKEIALGYHPFNPLKKAPQSWQYVYVEVEE